MKEEDKIQNNKLVLSINSSSVVDTLDLLRQELQKIEEVTTNAYKTNGTIDNININIQSETKKDNLIKMFSILLSKKEYYDKAQAKLEISTAPVFTEKGFTIEDYESDIKLRIRIIESDSRKKELESLINEAQSFMTKEDQFNQFIKKLENLRK